MPEIVEFAVAANNRGLLELVAIAQPLPGEELHVGESSAVFSSGVWEVATAGRPRRPRRVRLAGGGARPDTHEWQRVGGIDSGISTHRSLSDRK